MSITIYPYKLTRNALEARLPSGCSAMPGQWLRLEQTPPAYGQILEVFLMPSGVAGIPEGYGARIRLQGTISDLSPRQAVLLSASEITREIARRQGAMARPLSVTPDMAFDFDCLGPLTMVAGGDSAGRLAALQFLLPGLRAHRKVVIIDPLGLPLLQGVMAWRALREIRLSLRAVGDRRFLEAFGALFPERLRDVALRVMADYWPAATDDFIGFPPLSNLETAVNLPLRNLILQHCREIIRTGVFAEHAKEVFHPNRLLPHEALVANLSPVTAPWKAIFYEQVLQACFEDPDCLPVLIEPEGSLLEDPDWLNYIRKAQASGVSLLVLTSTQPSRVVTGLASNWIAVEPGGVIRIQGRLTQGLPVRLETPEVDMAMSVTSESRTDRPEDMSETVSETRPPTNLNEKPDGNLYPAIQASEAWTAQESETAELDAQPDLLPLAWSVLPAAPAEPDRATSGLERGAMAPEIVSPAEQNRLEWREGEETLNRLETLPAYPEREVEREAVPEEEASLPDPSAEAVGDTAFLTLEGLHEIMASSTTSASPPEDVPEAIKTSTEPIEPLPQDPQSMVVPNTPQSIEPATFQDAPDLPTPDTLAIAPNPEEMTGAVKEDVAEATHSAEVQPVITPEQAESGPNDVAPVFHDVSEPDIPPQPEVPEAPPEGLEEFSFDLEPDGASSQASEMNGNGRGHLSSWGSAIDRPETDLTETEMQEALDLIFPPYPDSDQPAETANALSEAPTPAQSEPEPIPVLPAQTDDASPAEPHGFRVGDRVTHPTYGAGVIQRMIPMEDSVILNITFDRVGKRLLDPALCPALRADAHPN